VWYKSLLLHPIINKFNFLYLVIWGFLFLKLDPINGTNWIFWSGLLAEAGYIGARLGLERWGGSLWQLRFLRKDSRERYFRLMARVRQIRTDFQNVQTLRGLLATQNVNVREMTNVFLELLILRSRIDSYVRGIHENYDQKIAEIKSRLPSAEGEIKKILAMNLETYEQRRSKYFEVMGKRAIIEARLDSIENTLNLVGDYAMSMAEPRMAQDQVELLVANVKDAETFISEIKDTVPQTGSMRMRVKG
jgi:hypothetical protein